MQSSAAVTLRALVMLICLVVVPLAAIFGSSLPQAFQSLVQGRGLPHLSRQNRKADEARNQGGDAPVFAPATDNVLQEAPAQVRRPDSSGSLWAPGALTAAAAGDRAANPVAPPMPGGGTLVPDVVPAVSRAAHVTQAPSAGSRDPRTGGEEFLQTEHRLRELGATYYLLETWGNSGQMYRFHCKVAVAPNSDKTQHFDATDTEPLRAMRKVLAQLEQFRAGILQ